MKFAVGYQLPEPDEEPLVEVVRDHREHVAEVYFPWLDMPSGRSPMASASGYTEEEARERLTSDLAELRTMGVGLDLLMNASCYGAAAGSRELADHVRSVVGHLDETVGLDAVTTMSPVIARIVKESFPSVDVRASINMRLGTVRAMEYVADLFDSYYVQREYNRDPARLAELRAWADDRSKKLCMLANSGCMAWCPVQTFHDNLVSHESEAGTLRPEFDASPAMCWDLLSRPENRVRFLQNTWVRPEDLRHYEGFFDVVKLATRQHANPRRVIASYVKGSYSGNLPDLLEPGHGPALAPWVIDNSRFPGDWHEQVTTGDGSSGEGDYYDRVLETVMVTA